METILYKYHCTFLILAWLDFKKIDAIDMIFSFSKFSRMVDTMMKADHIKRII